MTNTPKILVVDDEESICLVLKMNLELAGFRVDTVLSGEEALRLNLETYDLLLLDVMMEHISGFELAQRLRADERYKSIPIIFCTAKSGEDDLLQGFASGADDYIKKPFSMKELVARVKSVLHRTGTLSMQETLTFEGLELNMKRRSCTVDGEPVALTRKEFDLMAFMLASPDRIFSRAEILSGVWTDDVYVIDRTIDVNINRLRKKLGHYGSHIETKLGYGYGFTTDN